MINEIKNIIIIILLVITIILLFRSCKNNEISPNSHTNSEKVIKIKDSLLRKANVDIIKYQDSIKFIKAIRIQDVNKIQNVNEDLKIKNSELRQTNLLLANQKSFNTKIIKDTLIKGDTFLVENTFNYKDDWTTLKGMITSDSLIIDSLINFDFITINSGYKRVNLFKKELYVEVSNKNPNTVLLSNETVFLSKKKRRFLLLKGLLGGAIMTYIFTK
jgi:hypothetical protein